VGLHAQQWDVDQQGSKLVGNDAMGWSYQGQSVALSADGDTAIVGGLRDEPNGAAWVFTRSNGVWTQLGSKLVGTGAVGYAGQGSSVALSADGRSTAIIGGYVDNVDVGAAWVFTAPLPKPKTTTHDFNGDGKSDIALRDVRGNTAIWLMNGAAILSPRELGAVPTSWSMVGQRDFNGDGKADLLWQNINGDTSVWLMNGTQVSATPSLGVVGNGWSIVGTGDFNGDGYGDILWRNTNGDTSIWLMTGNATQVQVLSATDLGLVPTSWSVAQTGDFNGVTGGAKVTRAAT
jgi:FG-GAP-like repeat